MSTVEVYIVLHYRDGLFLLNLLLLTQIRCCIGTLFSECMAKHVETNDLLFSFMYDVDNCFWVGHCKDCLRWIQRTLQLLLVFYCKQNKRPAVWSWSFKRHVLVWWTESGPPSFPDDSHHHPTAILCQNVEKCSKPYFNVISTTKKLKTIILLSH